MVLDSNPFQHRHIGPDEAERDAMLNVVGAASLDALTDEAIPSEIRLKTPLNLPEGQSEYAFHRDLRRLASRNHIYRTFIGLGYYDCISPSVIVRNVLENPGWYTPYTPYQAEVAQGRLEGLLNFQTMVRDLTAMEVANASLLDEATAAGEAMTMLYRLQSRRIAAAGGGPRFFVADSCFPQTLDVLRSRAEPLGIELVIADWSATAFEPRVFGALVQSPDEAGRVHDLRAFVAAAHHENILVAVGTDLLSLTLLRPPGEIGADVAFGNSQRFGVPLWYGGPHAAFFATLERYVRQVPGRIVGVSRDVHGSPAYRMALQTREQHIRRERATSNICTAQALLANIAGFYAVYHGAQGLRAIARRVHTLAASLERELAAIGIRQLNAAYFGTLRLAVDDVDRLRQAALASRMNFRYRSDGGVNVALDETTDDHDLRAIVAAFAAAQGIAASPTSDPMEEAAAVYPEGLARSSKFLTHPTFNRYHSETEMMRYLRRLERKDIGLDTSMIPLGSCTMKLNAASEMLPITWAEFAKLHPFVPAEQAEGYHSVFRELAAALCEITGFAAVSLQPNSGAQGEFTGLMVIRAFHRHRGEPARNVVFIPASAHGTNPASAVLAGMQVVVIASAQDGNIDVENLRMQAAEHRTRLAALMITYPSTHGVFEENIREVCAIVHDHGGQVYLDGANMNAQVGLTSPAVVGADVCHLNLHKTFSIPHGGGGPGMGPIAVAEHLAPFLPGHSLAPIGGPLAIRSTAAAPWGSASILLISYGYIRMLGGQGMTDATRFAILNANYVKARLEPYYPVRYARPNGRVAHEMIFDLRPLKEASGIDETDVAKRLMDFGFHAPTVSFPVPGTLMVEPTESESKEELDRFCDAMIAIRHEIQAVIDGRADPRDNVLKNAPHTAAAVAADNWEHAYTREQAAFPLPFVRDNKLWPSVGRIDNPYGDRNLMCSCPPVEAFAER
ncbi:MAG: glycine dehydrogenase (aminomethyl-transferring) [Blastocatellia bacterium]|nr:MAG: glycine dehydrogenase (aminomethyl-transferring) [Blastocatellia bacterium]